MAFEHVWFWRSRLPERNGQQCRVLARGALNSILVQFESDGRKSSPRGTPSGELRGELAGDREGLPGG